MNKFWRVFGLTCLLLSLLPTAEAKGKKKEAAPQGTVIASVTPESITISGSNLSKTYAITRFTEILVKGQRAALTDLQPGMLVSVTQGSDPTNAARINAGDVPGPAPKK